MSGLGAILRAAARTAGFALAAWVATIGAAAAQDTVSIEVPSMLDFMVLDVASSTPGGPSPWTISFSNAVLSPGKGLRISVQADAAAFTPPGGTSIPASNVSWTIAGAAGGIGVNGTLSSSAYALVFQSDAGRTSGHIDLNWTLAAPGSGIRAGVHELSIRWKIESITP